jgi:hypothetical protein
MMENSKIGSINEQEALQLEKSFQETRSGRLDAFTVMMQTGSDIQEEMKHDRLSASDSLADLREALGAHRFIADLMETALNRLVGIKG